MNICDFIGGDIGAVTIRSAEFMRDGAYELGALARVIPFEGMGEGSYFYVGPLTFEAIRWMKEAFSACSAFCHPFGPVV
jgi:hypothetical protein